MIAKLIATLTLALSAVSAHAQAWQEILRSDQEIVSIDQTSIQIDGDEIQVKVLRDYHDTRLNLLDGRWHGFRSQTALYAVDCAEAKLGYLEWTLYKGSAGRGRVVHTGKVAGITFLDAAEGAGDQTLVAKVCASEVVLAHSGKHMLAAAGK